MSVTTYPTIDPPRRAWAPCEDFDGYRPGDECPRCGHNNWVICGQCEVHVALDNQRPGPAIRVWGYRDAEPSPLDGVMTIGPEWWCPECVASWELSREIERCRECGDAFHPDMEAVHGGVCDDCQMKGEEA